jgi:hypothetical protein
MLILSSSLIFAEKDKVNTYTGNIEDSYAEGSLKIKISALSDETLPGQYTLSAELKLNKVLYLCSLENNQSTTLGAPKYNTEDAILSNVTLICKPKKKGFEQLRITLGVPAPVKDYEDSSISLRKDKTLRGFISINPIVDTYFVK